MNLLNTRLVLPTWLNNPLYMAYIQYAIYIGYVLRNWWVLLVSEYACSVACDIEGTCKPCLLSIKAIENHSAASSASHTMLSTAHWHTLSIVAWHATILSGPLTAGIALTQCYANRNIKNCNPQMKFEAPKNPNFKLGFQRNTVCLNQGLHCQLSCSNAPQIHVW